MRVLQINAVNGISSTGRTTSELADYLNENGCEAYTAYSSGTPVKLGFKIGNTIDRKLHGLLSRVTGKQGYFSKSSTKDLIQWIGEIKPDIVHLRNLHGNYINLGLILQYLAKNDIPTVITLHDCWFYTGKCTHYTIDKCYKWKDKCGGCPRLKKDNKSWFFDQTVEMLVDKKKWYDKIPRLAVIGVSDWITNEAKKSILNHAKILTRIYDWIDLNKFKPVIQQGIKNDYGLENKFIILGVASGWSNAKGLDKFLRLAEKFEEDMTIVLVGNLPEKVKLPVNILKIPETHSIEELVKIYSMADVFVNFSPEESFGKVTAEALSCGIPVITNSSTANPELVGEGCGYITNNFEDVINRIRQIKIEGKNFYTKACIQFARKNFGSRERMLDHMKIYTSLIESE